MTYDKLEFDQTLLTVIEIDKELNKIKELIISSNNFNEAIQYSLKYNELEIIYNQMLYQMDCELSDYQSLATPFDKF
ncbi:hypothetical protein [Serratia sp. NFX21]|uniref:hypothetical protein n=1 Tax=Serratia sp. NFX21 TaxID=3402279 RepID=UPI003AF3C07C